MVVTNIIIMNAEMIAVEVDADSKSRNNAQFKLG